MEVNYIFTESAAAAAAFITSEHRIKIITTSAELINDYCDLLFAVATSHHNLCSKQYFCHIDFLHQDTDMSAMFDEVLNIKYNRESNCKHFLREKFLSDIY